MGYGDLAARFDLSWRGVSIKPLVLACAMMLSMSGRHLWMPIWAAADGELRRRARDRAKPAACLLKKERQWRWRHNEDGIMRCLS